MSAAAGTCRVEVLRGEQVESVHVVSVAVADAQGQLRASAGDPALRAFARSAIKIMQALPLLEDGAAERFGLAEEELALCCASHSGEPRHVELARSILRKIGADEDMLACGPHWPFDDAAARALREAGERPLRVHNNCSGKHSGMLALARFHGWPLAGYQELQHPVQQRMLRELSRWTDVPEDEVAVGVDGCGVATFSLPLLALARGFARLAGEARRGVSAAGQLVQITMRHPYLVAGTQRLCTALMESASGRIFAKVGAEGVYCAGVPGAELGIALKVHDGAARAAEPAMLAVLRALQVLSDEELNELRQWSHPEVRNTRGEVVGSLQCSVQLAAAHG